MIDNYKHLAKTHNSCGETALIVTPSDSVDLPFVSNGFWQIGPGSVRVTTKVGDVITLPAMPEGTIAWYWPFFVTRIWATGTTAADIVAAP